MGKNGRSAGIGLIVRCFKDITYFINWTYKYLKTALTNQLTNEPPKTAENTVGTSRSSMPTGIMIPTTDRYYEKIQAANYNMVSKSELLQSVLLFPYKHQFFGVVYLGFWPDNHDFSR